VGGSRKTRPLSCTHQSFPRPLISLPPSPMSSISARKIVYASARNKVADDFYTILLSNVRSSAPDLPLDPVVFRSLLLCILASGANNLLLRSHDEDISLVQNITALVSAHSSLLVPRPTKSECQRHVSIPQADRGSIR